MLKVTQIENLEANSILQAFASLQSKLEAITLFVTPQPQAEYLTRNDVSKLLKVSLVTVHAWSNAGILQPYKIGNKVRYKREDVEKALIKTTKKGKGAQ